MGSIYSSITPQPSINTQQAFKNSNHKAKKIERVSHSNLNNLVKTVNNCPAQLTFVQYLGILCHSRSLDYILNKQCSKQFDKKNAKIIEALTKAEQQLTFNAVIEHTAWEKQVHSTQINEVLKNTKQVHTDEINQALENISKIIPGLESRANKASDEVKSTIANLCQLKSRQKARDIISRKCFSEFSKFSAITHSLFPSYMEEIEGPDGCLRWQEFSHPNAATWLSLNSLGRQQAAAQEAVNIAPTLINHPDNFVFNEPDSTGMFMLTQHQQALLDFANAIS